MLRNRRERGESNFGCLIALVLLLLAILVAWKMIPIKVKAAEMRDIVSDEARSAGQHNDGQIRAAILDQAKKLELPIGEDNIKTERRNSYITVEVTYTVPVTFPGYTFNWDFHHKSENPIF
ncbi:MAG: hypothetical protein QOH21_2047 [Acidobacteriota bacterium]|jgi:hypothetical protein|nr:hypothetical protein [Acidobacteriota bacterium]